MSWGTCTSLLCIVSAPLPVLLPEAMICCRWHQSGCWKIDCQLMWFSSQGPSPDSPYKRQPVSPPRLTPCLLSAAVPNGEGEEDHTQGEAGTTGGHCARMATLVEPGADIDPSISILNPSSTSPSLSHRFLDNKFYLLVVIGEIVTEDHLRCAITNIERGKHWQLALPGQCHPHYRWHSTSYLLTSACIDCSCR